MVLMLIPAATGTKSSVAIVGLKLVSIPLRVSSTVLAMPFGSKLGTGHQHKLQSPLENSILHVALHGKEGKGSKRKKAF